MKTNFINKLAIAAMLLVTGLSFGASHVFASGSLDQDPDALGNGFLTSAIQPSSYIGPDDVTNAQPGDVVMLNIYYHNKGDQTINNVRIRFSPRSTGATTSQTFTGSISGDGVQTITDTTRVNISSSQTLTFIPGSVRWFPNQTGGTNLNGQTISASDENALVGGSGFNIGSLTPGWPSQGGIVAKFQVSQSQTPVGQAPTVSTTPATYINQATGAATLNGYYDANGDSTTTYFQYRIVGSSSWTTVGSINRGTGSGTISFPLTGLASGNYEFQAVAENSFGTVSGGTLNFHIQNDNTQCPSGTYGTYPNCIPVINQCPIGTTGTYPNCVPITHDCGTGYWDGYQCQYPVTHVCPSGTTGIYPNCIPVVQACGYNQYWNGYQCVTNVQTCSFGQYWNGSSCVTTVQTCGYNQYWNGYQCVTNQTTNNAPSVSTLGTISVGGSVAIIDGYYSANGCSVSTSFQYGTSQNFGSTTVEVTRGTNSGSMAQSISGLTPGVTYYYRAVARNCVSTVYGDTRSFQTQALTTNDTTIIRTVYTNNTNTNNTNTVGGLGGSSFIKLMIDNHRQTVSGGRDISYEVSWQNLTKSTLKKLVLEVNFPTQMSVIDTDHGSLERNKNTVVYEIDSLGPLESGSMIITTQVTGNLREGDPVVAQAIMAFENPKTSATENAIAYDADTFSTTGSALGASLFGLGFLPTSLIGWLIILLIIILIVLLARHYMNQNKNQPMVHVSAQPGSQVVATQVPGPQAGAAPTQDYIVYRPTPRP